MLRICLAWWRALGKMLDDETHECQAKTRVLKVELLNLAITQAEHDRVGMGNCRRTAGLARRKDTDFAEEAAWAGVSGKLWKADVAAQHVVHPVRTIALVEEDFGCTEFLSHHQGQEGLDRERIGRLGPDLAKQPGDLQQAPDI